MQQRLKFDDGVSSSMARVIDLWDRWGHVLWGHHMPLGGVTSLGAFFLGRRGNGGTQWHVIMGPLIQRRLSLANAFFRIGQDNGRSAENNLEK